MTLLKYVNRELYNIDPYNKNIISYSILRTQIPINYYYK